MNRRILKDMKKIGIFFLVIAWLALSAGCVRLANEDVEELFLYIPDGTPVTITD